MFWLGRSRAKSRAEQSREKGLAAVMASEQSGVLESPLVSHPSFSGIALCVWPLIIGLSGSWD